MKKRIYSREFYKAVINNLAQDVDTQTMINAVSLATLLVPKDRLYEEVDISDGHNGSYYPEVDKLVDRMPDSQADPNFKMTPLTKTTVDDSIKLYDLAELAKKAQVDAMAARTWLLTQGITPAGYGNNAAGDLVAGYPDSVLEQLIRHAWEINNKKGDGHN